MTQKHMLFFGFGFSAATLARHLPRSEWKISATSRSTEGAHAITALGHNALMFQDMQALPPGVTHVVVSIPPDERGDPVIERWGEAFAQNSTITWLAYLSTTGVYGDHQGAWVDENTPLTPNTDRGHRRLAAEKAWLALNQKSSLPVHLFRLAGIYGERRNAIENLRAGTAKRIIRAGQIFSRIHVEDIAGILQASMTSPNPGRAYNVADDEPSPPQDVIAYAAHLLHVAPPPEIPFEHATLSPMARSFFMDSKAVSNRRVKQELGYQFKFPNYRVGLQNLLR